MTNGYKVSTQLHWGRISAKSSDDPFFLWGGGVSPRKQPNAHLWVVSILHQRWCRLFVWLGLAHLSRDVGPGEVGTAWNCLVLGAGRCAEALRKDGEIRRGSSEMWPRETE